MLDRQFIGNVGRPLHDVHDDTANGNGKNGGQQCDLGGDRKYVDRPDVFGRVYAWLSGQGTNQYRQGQNEYRSKQRD